MKLKSLFALAGFAVLSAVSSMSHAEAQLGRDYTVYSPPQPTEAAKGKIEVTEFFSYACSHCADLEPKLHAWVKTLPKDVTFRRVPAIFRTAWAPSAKVYYTLEALGLTEKLNGAFFDAIHKDRMNPSDEKAIFEWAGKNGVDAAKFAEVYRSFSVQSKTQNADRITRAHNIQGTPALVINGKYLLPNATQLDMASELIAKARAESKSK